MAMCGNPARFRERQISCEVIWQPMSSLQNDSDLQCTGGSALHIEQTTGDDSDITSSNAAADFIDETIAIWQKRSKRKLTREDGREIIENMTGFFRVLMDWDQAEQAAKRGETKFSKAEALPARLEIVP
jgi:hypothetical protein